MSLWELSPAAFLFAAAVLFAGGMVKGILGIALPLVGIPLLTFIMPVQSAIAVMAAPVLMSNLQQLHQATGRRAILKRLWPLLVALVTGIVVGVHLLAGSDPEIILLLLAVAIVVFVAINFFAPRLVMPPRLEKPLGLLAGGVGGLFGGMTSIYGPPIILYVLSMRPSRETFIAYMAVILITGTIPLYSALAVYGILGWEEGLFSLLLVLPVLLGMALGRRLRGLIPEESFRLVIMLMLLVISANLVRKALFPG